MSTEIQLIQQPIIKHDLLNVGKAVTERILSLNLENLVATEETVKALKSLRAELNKEFDEYEAQRKAIKEAVANPYMEFEAVYKSEIQVKYKGAVELLKDKIAIVEDKIKSEKKENVIRYFNELCAVEKVDFLTFDKLGIEINLSTSEKAYKEKCNEFVQRVQDDVLLIQVQQYAVEIMAEYKKTLNASKAITTVIERKEAEKLEAERLHRQETTRRETMLRNLTLVYKDITRSFHFVSDENIFITHSDIEKLSKEEFQKVYVEIELKVIEFLRSREPQTPEVKQAPIATPEPLQAPTETKPTEPEKQFTAAFEVTATMQQLTALANYMKSNGLNYKNI